jgi:hypothetical protein
MSAHPSDASAAPDRRSPQSDLVPGPDPSAASSDPEDSRSGVSWQQTPHQPYDQQVPPGYGQAGYPEAEGGGLPSDTLDG